MFITIHPKSAWKVALSFVMVIVYQLEMTQIEFEAIIGDQTKRITGDIRWAGDIDHSPALEFRTDVDSDAGYPLFVNGSFNPLAQTLSFTLVHRGTGRIYALDLGKDHHNRSCHYVGEKHKHRWQVPLRDTEAYVPTDITANIDNVRLVCQQFCMEAKINHGGAMQVPPPQQQQLPL
jgi:hypothetical protein